MKPVKTRQLWAVVMTAAAAVAISAQAYQGMAISKLHVNGKNLQNTSSQNVRLMGAWMQPEATWFNGQGKWYSDPTDWTSTANVAGLLNFMNGAADVMSDTSAKYGASHGWYCTFVRMNTDYVGGWTSASGLVDSTQFNAWIQNFLVPYANHLRSRGLYLVLSATGPMVVNVGGNGNNNASQGTQSRLITFWQTVANAAGVKGADNIMFELMNEPVCVESSPGNGDWGNHAAKYFQAFQSWTQPIINAIRNTGADNVIWVPCLEWEGSPYQWAQYPFSGSNIGVASHYYPAYGGVHDNTAAVTNLWNSEYQPAANNWPMIITECFWFQEPNNPGDLDAGSTAGFGNALKGCIDGAGNVSWLIGFLSDDLTDLNTSLPANCTLSSKDGAQAAFAWFYGYNGSSGPVANGTYKLINLNSGLALDATGAQTTNGTQLEQWTYHSGNNQQWTITSLGSSLYQIMGVQSGKSVDISNWGTTNGTKVQLWTYDGGSNQKYYFNATSGGYYEISPSHATGSCLDVSGVSKSPGAIVWLWQWLSGANQQWSPQAP